MLKQKIISTLTAIITLLTLWFCPAKPAEGVFSEKQDVEKIKFDEGVFEVMEYDLVVSPEGDDSNPGTEEMPLRTFSGAKEKLKERKDSVPSDKEVTVWFREGRYLIDEKVNFDSDDFSNVVYRSVPGEDVIFTGAVELSDWTEGEINDIKALVADVDTEKVYFRSLFKGEERLPVSVWPEEGSFTAKNADIKDALNPNDESGFFKLHTAFYANEKEIMNFANLEDVNVRIMHKWCDDILPLHSVDVETGRVEVRKPAAMTIEVNDNYVYENVREAVNNAGEWYLDRSEGKLYYIPCEGETAENLVLSAPVNDSFIEIDGMSDITFSGIRFVNTDWDFVSGTLNLWPMDKTNPNYEYIEFAPTHPQASYEIPAAITIANAENINIINCTFRSISDTAVMFKENVKNSAVDVCHFDEIGGNAIFINAPYAIPAVTREISITNCEINEYGRIYNHSIGVLLCHASDCIIENNEIHDGWYTAISVGWVWGYAENPTDNIQVKDNLIYNIGNGWLSDMGGIYTLGIQPGTVLSGNVIYNVGCYGGEQGYGGWGIYLDEGSTEMLVENNLVYDCSSQAFHQHYGRDNVIRNNIFAFGGEGIFRITRNEEHNSLVLENNIFVSDDRVMYWETIAMDWFKDNSNLYWDYGNKAVYSGSSTKLTERHNIVDMVGRGYYNNAVFADPLFRDASNRDFTLAENSPALDAGFVPWEYKAGTRYTFNG
ncbi:MAG: right-handed parallel beta-helix repeat-containing protein [Clostridia bacterium]|nr:right-handed parallel beta-helix repeat-containing protein [Clostridia bacterium]